MARAAVDLLVWRKVSSLDGDNDHETAFEQDGRIDLPATVAQRVADSVDEFADTVIVPCLDATQDATQGLEPITWCPPRAARLWVNASETFTVACLANHGRSLGIAPLWPGLGEERAKRLVGFLETYAQREFIGYPSLSERAKIAEMLAGSLPRGHKRSVARWNAFYRDLVEFMDGSPLAACGSSNHPLW